jgi:FAD/FMN-containing dehydrogenase
MLLIPAIDLKDGQCVRLKQGDMDQSTTFGEDPAVMGMLPAPVRVKLQKPQERARICFGADEPRRAGDASFSALGSSHAGRGAIHRPVAQHRRAVHDSPVRQEVIDRPVLGAAIEDGLVTDAAIAESIAQSRAMWHLRESIPLAEAGLGKSIKHDVSIPISLISTFVKTTNAALQVKFPGIQHIVFGHLGDGNLHYNVARAPEQTEEQLLAKQYDVYQLVHDSVHAHGGSISAEHGVGQLKRDELTRYKSSLELTLMKQIKKALDPQGIMNPGKVLQA